MHIFKYSPREGTLAAKMTNQIDGNIKEERSQKLIELSNKNEKKYNEKYIGKEVEVLFEEEKDGLWSGYTKNYIRVFCESDENLENNVKKVIPKEVYELRFKGIKYKKLLVHLIYTGNFFILEIIKRY